jgi:hypothetical protein
MRRWIVAAMITNKEGGVMRRWIVAAMAMVCLVGVSTMKASAEEGWKFEITPYIWFVGIDADLTILDREVDLDVGFSDLIDKVDFAGELFLTAQKGPWVLWSQCDYMAMSDEFDVTVPSNNLTVNGDVNNDTWFLAGGAGYQFIGGLTKNATTDVLVGVRYLSMDNEVKLSAPALGVSRTVQRDTGITDAILIIRPSIPITEKLRFNPTVSIGTGDSDLVYELQPQLQYQFTDSISGRLGYRRLYYDVDKDNVKFDGAFHGFILGLGVTF